MAILRHVIRNCKYLFLFLILACVGTLHQLRRPPDSPHFDSEKSAAVDIKQPEKLKKSEKPVAVEDSIKPPSCLWPLLDPWDESISEYTASPPKTVCPRIQPELAHLDLDGTLHIAANDSYRKELICLNRTISGALYPNQSQLSMTYPAGLVKGKSMKMDTDMFEISCFPEKLKGKTHLKNEIYRQAFMQIAPKKDKNFTQSTEERLSLDIIVLDSVSLPQFRRHMPKTLRFIRDQMGFLIFEKPGKVGDNTLVNMIPLLTGKRLVEPNHTVWDNVSSEYPTDRPLEADTDFPFIWKDFSKSGCVTMFNVDPILMGFGFLFYPTKFVHGFRSPPTDYYFRPAHHYFVSHPYGHERDAHFCKGSHRDHDIMMNVTKQWFKRYSNTCHFSLSLTLHNYTHQFPSDLERLDEDFYKLFRDMYNSDRLNRSIILLMGDHGHRLSTIRFAFQGQVEERMAFFSLYFPPWFRTKYPTAWRNLQENSQRLVTHFDLHATLRDIQKGRFEIDQTENWQQSDTRGISLFEKIPTERTCSKAGILPQFCVCLVRTADTISDSIRLRARHMLSDWLRRKSIYCKDCHDDDVEILKMESYTTNEYVRRGIRHFDPESILSLKQPSKIPVEFFWVLIRVRHSKTDSKNTLLTVQMQHNKSEKELKVLGVLDTY